MVKTCVGGMFVVSKLHVTKLYPLNHPTDGLIIYLIHLMVCAYRKWAKLKQSR